MNTVRNILIMMIVAIFMQGCVKSQSFTPYKNANNRYFSASITPIKSYTGGYDGFSFNLDNKSNFDIEIDWNRTLFVDNGNTRGSFMYDGIMYIQRNNRKSPDFVFGKSSLSKVIYPNSNVYYYKGWRHKDFNGGVVGMVLAAKVNGKSIREKIYIKIKDNKK